MRTRFRNTMDRAALAALGAGSLLLADCSTAVDTKPAASMTQAQISGRPVPDSMAAEASAEAVRHFNIQVTASGGGPAEAIRQAVEGRLADNGYKLNADVPDIKIRLAVRSAEFDRAGNYIRYEGTVEAGVNRVWDDKRLGFKSISARGKRGLGADEATRNLTADLAERTAAFLMKSARPEQSGLAALDVTIRRPWLSTPDPDYAQRFIQTVKAQRGVVYCAMVAHDYETKVLTFRIAYLAQAMPEGLLNRLASMKDLAIKPGN